MFCLSDFYNYCKENDVDVIAFNRLPAAAATVRYCGDYSVGLNFERIIYYEVKTTYKCDYFIDSSLFYVIMGLFGFVLVVVKK